MAEIIKLHMTSPEKLFAALPPAEEIEDVVCIFKTKDGATQVCHTEMEVQRLAYYTLELQRHYDSEQLEMKL